MNKNRKKLSEGNALVATKNNNITSKRCPEYSNLAESAQKLTANAHRKIIYSEDCQLPFSFKLCRQLRGPKVVVVFLLTMEMKRHRKNRTNLIAGTYWINISQKELTKTIKIFSLSTIRRACAKLEKMGIIKCESFNKRMGDHTKFYTVIDRQVLTELEYVDEVVSKPALANRLKAGVPTVLKNKEST